MKTEPIRILQIVSSINQGNGVLCVVKNWHHYIDQSKIQFDYLYFNQTAVTCQEEIEKLGGNIYQIPDPSKSPLKFLRESYRFFKTHRYRTVHSHLTNLNFFFLPLAKIFGAKNIIQHAHTRKWGTNSRSAMRNYLLVHAVWPLITHKLACSDIAGKSFFGTNFDIVHNGIDTEKFAYNPVCRVEKRKELGLEDAFIIGHVGRFSPEKNHTFLIDVFASLCVKEPKARLVLVGCGPLEQKIKDLVVQKGLQDKIMFLGARKDLDQLYQAFDVFVLPSLQEGFGLVAIEAQAAGLPCILADTLPKEVLICNYQVLALQDVKKWADIIVATKLNFKRCDCSQKIKQAGLAVQEISSYMQNFYLTLEG